MTNLDDSQNDPTINQFVTKVMEMAPEPPAYPGVVVATEEPARRFPAWVWAPVAAVLVLAVIVPIALRSGNGDGITAAGVTSTTIQQTDLAGAESIDTVSPAPAVESERNVLVAAPTTVGPGGLVEIDFTGERVQARSDVFWMDRFDYSEQAWISEFVLWSDRSEGGMSSAASAVVTIAVPEPTITEAGVDRVTIPTGLQLGTYRVCVALVTSTTPCVLLEVSDASVPNTTIPPQVVGEPGPFTPDFGLLAALPGDGTLIATPYQLLIGPDADRVAIGDGVIEDGETLPNGFYLKPMLGGSAVELEPAPGFVAVVLDPGDPSVEIELSFDEWVSWVQPKPGAASVGDLYAFLEYDTDGRVTAITQQYVP